MERPLTTYGESRRNRFVRALKFEGKLNLRHQVYIQLDLSSRQLEIGIWNVESESKLEIEN